MHRLFEKKTKCSIVTLRPAIGLVSAFAPPAPLLFHLMSLPLNTLKENDIVTASAATVLGLVLALLNH
jgi:hypothetical protein